MTYLLSLDEGTSSARAAVFKDTGEVCGLAQESFTQHFPKPGLVEHDASEIWRTQETVIQGALQVAGLTFKDIKGIGITNQRETTVLWNRKTGLPLANAIVWQDRRTSELCNRLKAEGLDSMIQEKTGLVIDAYFSATKLQWLLDSIPDARRQAERGELAFGTIDSWLVWNLTGGKVHITDPSNASRTMLFNIKTGCWDPDLLDLFKIPHSLLPKVIQSSEICGHYHNVPIAGIAGDQQAALFGQACFEPGMVKNTYGTGCFMLLNTGTQPVASNHKLLTTVAWKINNQSYYALEGSVFEAGTLVQWLRDGLGIIEKSSDIEALANSVPDNGGVYIVPAFSGLGAPHWDQYARGIITGLTRGAGKKQIARAALEAIAFQVFDILQAMKKDSGIDIKELRVDGGASNNKLLMQMQADIADTTVVQAFDAESSAKGAAQLAGLAVGVWKDTDQIAAQWKAAGRFQPQIDPVARDENYAGWLKAVSRAIL